MAKHPSRKDTETGVEQPGKRGDGTAKKVAPPKPGVRCPFVSLQVDIVGHSHLPASAEKLSRAKDLFHEKSKQIVNDCGGRDLPWRGDGGAFLFPVTDDSEFGKACQSAFDILYSLPEVNQQIQNDTGHNQLLRIRVSLDYGEAIDHEEPGRIDGDFLNAFLKNERLIAQPDTVTVTERVYTQLGPAMKARFGLRWYSREVGSLLYRSDPVGNPPLVWIWLDSSHDAFINHLVTHDAIWIVGITNEHLAEHLGKAFAGRDGRPWNEIRVLFQARHLVELVREGGAKHTPAWERGVSETIEFFLHEPKKADKLDIRHVNRILPFVGQFYDYHHVRVAYVLPVPDIQRSCYLNCVAAPRRPGDRPAPPPPAGDEAAKQFEAIQHAFEHLRNASTPLLTANVVGCRAPDGSFQFESLIPQDNWANSAAVFGRRMDHLITFILLYGKNHLYLQYRNEMNSNNQLHVHGVLPGKVNDGDFFETGPSSPVYWHEISEMQKSFDALAPGSRNSPAFTAARQLASAAFSGETGIKTKSSVHPDLLRAACRRAAVRYLDEKLGLTVPVDGLYPVRARPDRPYYVDTQDYALYAQLFALRLTPEAMERIEIRRPFAKLIPTTLKEFQTLKDQGKLTLFLDHHFDEINAFLAGQLRPS